MPQTESKDDDSDISEEDWYFKDLDYKNWRPVKRGRKAKRKLEEEKRKRTEVEETDSSAVLSKFSLEERARWRAAEA